MRTRAGVPLLLILALLAALLGHVAGRSGSSSGAIGPGATLHATVARVVDGDTIVVGLPGGDTERVRYIGMDTPEDVKPDTPVQCFALRAAAENKRLVAGRRVRLVVGAEPRDRYGRLLAYVYREPDQLLVDAALLRGGYAHTLAIAPNTAFAPRFDQLQAEARAKGAGLWGACPQLAESYR